MSFCLCGVGVELEEDGAGVLVDPVGAGQLPEPLLDGGDAACGTHLMFVSEESVQGELEPRHENPKLVTRTQLGIKRSNYPSASKGGRGGEASPIKSSIDFFSLFSAFSVETVFPPLYP